MASFFAVTLTAFYTINLVKQKVEFSFFKSIYKPLFAAFIMAGIVFVLGISLATNLAWVIFITIVGAAIYSVSIYIIAKEQLKEGIKLVFGKI